MSKKNIGSSFDEFLTENATLDESTAIAVKRVIAWQIEQEMKAQNLNKTMMAKKMHTSRAALNRLLDENDTDHISECSGGIGEKAECRVVGGLKINRGTSLRFPHHIWYIQLGAAACGLPHTSPRSHPHYQRTPCHPCRKETV